MGRSNSCFKIITCGSDSAGNDDLDVSESKGSNDKRGWSFRKKSARHRVLSNSVVTETASSVKKESLETADVNFQTPSSVKQSLESTDVSFQTPSSAKKESLELTNVNFQPPNISNVPEKIPTIQCIDEKPQFPTPVEPKTSETIIETDADDSPLDESVVIVIQAAVRGILAQRELLKLKNVVKLQAAVRGHLVRRHAVGTLRCVQAIVKMQTLVRARYACLGKEPDWKAEEDTCNSVTSKGNLVTKPNATRTSIQNLLSNRFARQLMESTPKNKPIHIKCDPAKQDSAWNWLERWMSVSSAKQTLEPGSKIEHSGNEKNENFASPVETKIPSEVLCDSADSKSRIRETDVLSKIEENLITHDADKFNFQQSQPTSVGDDLELSQPENNGTSDVNEISIETDSHQSQIVQSDAPSQQELKSLSNKPEMESEPPKRSMKRFASEDLETEGKKFVFGSRKASNPAFVVAHSKFEELSSSANSGKSISSQHQDVSVDSNANNISSGANSLTRTKNLSIGENSVSRIQYGGSECGTELSISSTLDSPDRYEAGNTEHEHSAKVSENEICDPKSLNNLDVKASDASTIPTYDASHSIVGQPEKVDDVRNESVNSLVVIDAAAQQKPDNSAPDFHKEPDLQTGHQMYRSYRSSPEASPRSHITVPESQGTPSSQVSVKAKNNRSDKSGSYRKRKPLSASKGSPSNPSQNSGARSSTEQLPKNQKNGKRRSSFGSSRTDNIDQEPGDNSSSSSLPHFMQATESARAKIQANNSPRSSPDVQDRDTYIKKRHSLPVANGRHGSPRIQRSLSQAQQGAKGNEKKWQR
ncbi:protein IQ-DOMAIN 32 [Citrus sinensis]|uniref:Protein IQ-DOMAIN 32 n=1 Tax=Citrus sinensis TaxID=2711 RepID=A0ACB8KX21_CITSI|nr:protein IQ-DOMAIN 32 [Citrus sinensis]